MKDEGEGWKLLKNPPKVEAVLNIFVAILLLIAAEGLHPYSFYIVLRLVATIGALYWAITVYQRGPRGWSWVFAAVGLLLNPILPVRMQRSQWQPIDLWLGILLLSWSVYWQIRRAE